MGDLADNWNGGESRQMRDYPSSGGSSASPCSQLVDLWMRNAEHCDKQASLAAVMNEREDAIVHRQAAQTFRACAYALKDRLSANVKEMP